MRPETKPLMFASMNDAAWYLGKGVCQNYSWDETNREQAANLIIALIAYFNNKQFSELLEIFKCAQQYTENRDSKVVRLPVAEEKAAE
jgi:hypothetical protein